MENEIKNILKMPLEEKIKTNQFYQAAFTHKSYSNENHLSYSYERLEFLGDAVLSVHITHFIWEHFPNMDEGELTNLRSKAVRQETLAAASLSLGLEKYLFLGHGEENTGGKQRVSILSDVFESFLAAVYLDLGHQAVDKVLNLTLYEWIISNSFDSMVDYKTKLQEYVQNEKRNPIVYKLLEQNKKNNITFFVIGVYLDDILLGKGQGSTKKKAEQEAAKAALEKLSKEVK
ncbi:ribonuclease III [Spiroplasma platyhelix]|uniref:Ribonuclease 3 n=1 Tax=Spiroplasma platyhelix PALS-1 TaxID=1276218 RepID=A0A846U3S9_9MOLU|nr:ribonuclease III [Spiroplasma platyhelix]MBE4703774.1 Ribonuclease 3 [Spiroplasma platyhelix PALS-1]NKE38147.1 ribonuclease III [Spiroplasma platyhelix PALS-1]UJB29032.1 ribonuclease III [Spiroplasma platyhelix PALS-1]